VQQDSDIGLRERKKAASRLAIERAAVEIASEQGYEATTVQAIATGAGISLRTFFNYFPCKDEAIVGSGLNLIDEQRALQILEECGSDLLGGINRVAEACVAQTGCSAELMRQRRHLIQRYPHLVRPRKEAIERFEAWLAYLVVQHLRTQPADRHLADRLTAEQEAILVVVVVASAIRYLLLLSAEQDLDAVAGVGDIEQVIGMMGVLYQEAGPVRVTARARARRVRSDGSDQAIERARGDGREEGRRATADSDPIR
jgi:AcrR family transcriptional regulator